MISENKYKKFFVPGFLILVFIAVLLGFDAMRNLADHTLDSGISSNVRSKDLELLQPVSKHKGIGNESIEISRDINPFTKDHQDWIENKQQQIKHPSKLNLKVLAVLKWQGEYKVNLLDLAEKDQGGFWLKEGDYYKGYEVYYVGPFYMIFKGDEKNIRVSLRDSKGRLYQGQGEVFVAPDVDSYLRDLREKMERERLLFNATNDTAHNASIVNTANATNSSWNDRLDGDSSGGKPDAQSTGQGGSEGGSGSAAGSSDSERQPTRDEEMQFIQEIMKIFKE